ncbi:SBBP repeat-containing protein [Mechercharimyces sp. CAU 1602]|uniref:SBBP repeat-containing protein n=1 Tax=Mechercharimyces sp. CAU 1602 TaxID=2973933 RepID=UPI00216194C0|nr:SBBP repeat-containing protein [Mechercharimyces sp. CAU 1602]MCS1350234.1 SBBP repeat-containing protein [Mechercharimyces sp. CAU 1602]
MGQKNELDECCLRTNTNRKGKRQEFIANGQGGMFTFHPEGMQFTLPLEKHREERVSPLRLLWMNPCTDLILMGDKLVEDGWFQETEYPFLRYQRVLCQGVWKDIDLVFYGDEQQLKYDVIIHPGADIEDIRFSYQGTEAMTCSEEGDLYVYTPHGVLCEKHPISFQKDQSNKIIVPSSFQLYPDHSFGFHVATSYDPEKVLVIDPAVIFSTYLGGTGRNAGCGIAVDDMGNSYVTGVTASPFNFPVTSGAFQTINIGEESAFVTKFNPTGSSLIYSTLLAGNQFDFGNAIAVDSSRNAYVTGLTTSPDFPVTSGSFQTQFMNADNQSFVTKLNPTGTSLIYSTFLGGSGIASITSGNGIAVDMSNNAYVTGNTNANNFPTTPGAFQTIYKGIGPTLTQSDVFVTKFNETGSALTYSTFLGGINLDQSGGIVVDKSNQAYVVGCTLSTDFPVTPNAFQTIAIPGNSYAFVTKFNAAGSGLIYSTLLGNGNTEGAAIDIDGMNNAYVTGFTDSVTFPVTRGAFQTRLNDSLDAFVTKFNDRGSRLLYSTYLGGSLDDEGFGIAVDALGTAWVTGCASSTDFPITSDAFQDRMGGVSDAFTTQISYSGRGINFSSYLGGNDTDEGAAVAIDSQQNIYFTGITLSTDFPVSFGAFQLSFGPVSVFSSQAFVFKLGSLAQSGPTGPAGPTGPQGPRGPRGARGPRGIGGGESSS